MATRTPFDGDVERRRRQAVREKLQFSELALRHRLGIYGLVALALVPTVLTPLELDAFTFVLFLMMFAISWDVVSGYTGQLSFGHAFFFAIGGYGTAVLTSQHGLHPFLGIFLATVVAAVGGVLIGVPALRLDGPYLSLVTLIAPLLLLQSFILFNSPSIVAPDGLGGTSGLTEQPPQIVGLGSDAIITTDSFMVAALGTYYVAFFTLLIILAVCYGVTRSSAGSVFTAIREDEDAVRASGLNPAKFKIFAFVLSGAVGGLAGAVWMHAGGFPNTENLFGQGRIDLSIEVIIMSIIGGMGTVVGAAVGALFFALIAAIVGSLNFEIPLLGLEFADLSPLPTFLIAMLILVFMPRGVLPEAIDRGRRIHARYHGNEPPEPPGGNSPSESIIAKYRREINEIIGRDNG